MLTSRLTYLLTPLFLGLVLTSCATSTSVAPPPTEAATVPSSPEQASPPAPVEPLARVESVEPVTLVESLEHPWGLVWLPNGDMLITERPGRVRLVRDGQLDPNPIAGVPDVLAQGQGGLLDIALHPDFAGNRWVYLPMLRSSNANQPESPAPV
ncbi:MAG: PQQ-dependent sugar dehydrogenase, partial [Leptolyngbyaceae cyanobacterium SM2_3_12]|nr:PQQ-dependent sugar dehydrogenase [Leptolyngbyaceae cyanobacterium SM2_3_12]